MFGNDEVVYLKKIIRNSLVDSSMERHYVCIRKGKNRVTPRLYTLKKNASAFEIY